MSCVYIKSSISQNFSPGISGRVAHVIVKVVFPLPNIMEPCSKKEGGGGGVQQERIPVPGNMGNIMREKIDTHTRIHFTLQHTTHIHFMFHIASIVHVIYHR
jgi:hypothetical protein